MHQEKEQEREEWPVMGVGAGSRGGAYNRSRSMLAGAGGGKVMRVRAGG